MKLCVGGSVAFLCLGLILKTVDYRVLGDCLQLLKGLLEARNAAPPRASCSTRATFGLLSDYSTMLLH